MTSGITEELEKFSIIKCVSEFIGKSVIRSKINPFVLFLSIE